MATRTSVQSGPWSDAATWGAAAPGAGDRAVITGGHSVWVDGDITVGDGSASAATPAIMVYGDLHWRNQVGDAAANWTLTINGWVYLNSDATSSGQWFIGSSGVVTVGPTTVSVGAIPATRTAKVYFSLAASYHEIYILKANVAHPGQPGMYFYGSNPGIGDAPTASGTVDSATDDISFIDFDLVFDAKEWQGAWLEITGGTNIGEYREVTAFDAFTGKISWSNLEPMPYACDNTTTYTLRHTYQRAYLTSGIAQVAPGVPEAHTLVLDRPVDYLVNQTVALSTGASLTVPVIGWRSELALITGKTDNKTYTVTTKYSHGIGDFAILMNRNIWITCINPAGASPNRGLQIHLLATRTTTPTFIFNWVQFKNVGYTGYFMYMLQAANFPTIKNCTVQGVLYNNDTDLSPPQLWNAPGKLFPTAQYQLDNVHCHAMASIIVMSGWQTLASGDTIAEQKSCVFRDLTLIGQGAGSSYLANLANSFVVMPVFKNTWYAPISPNTHTGGYGVFYGTINGETLRVNGQGNGSGFYLTDDGFSATVPAAGRTCKIKNCKINGLGSGSGIQLGATDCTTIEVTNSRFINSAVAIRLINGITSNILLTNNMYDNITSSSYGALTFETASAMPFVYESNSKYGTITPNTRGNVAIPGAYNMAMPGRYISYNCTYVSPTTPSYGPAATNAVIQVYQHTVLNPQNTWYYLIAALNMFSAEVNNATINGTPGQHLGLLPGGHIVTKTDHPVSPRTNSNIKLKVIPGSAIDQCAINMHAPIVYPKNAGVLTVSIYALKTAAQELGKRPMLHVLVNGKHLVKEMSDVVNTWEQLSITYILTAADLAMIWLSCCNNPRYIDSDASSYLYEPLINSVNVYFDELSIS